MIGYVKTECVIFCENDEMVEFYAEIVINMVISDYSAPTIREYEE